MGLLQLLTHSDSQYFNTTVSFHITHSKILAHFSPACEIIQYLLSPARAMADLELKLAQFSFSSVIRGHHVYLATHLRMRIANVHMNIIKCGYCSRAATITLSLCFVRRLFEGGVYSGCGVYSRKYGNLFSKQPEVNSKLQHASSAIPRC